MVRGAPTRFSATTARTSCTAGLGNDLLFGGRDSDSARRRRRRRLAQRRHRGRRAEARHRRELSTPGDVFNGYGGNGLILNADGTTGPDVVQDDSATATDILLSPALRATTRSRSRPTRKPTPARRRLQRRPTISAIWKSATGVPLVRQIQVLGLERQRPDRSVRARLSRASGRGRQPIRHGPLRRARQRHADRHGRPGPALRPGRQRRPVRLRRRRPALGRRTRRRRHPATSTASSAAPATMT